MDDTKPINKKMDADLRHLPRMNFDFQRTVHNVYAALLSNVKIEMPEGEEMPRTTQDAILLDIFIQLCTHGIVGKILRIRPNTNPAKREAHEPFLDSVQRSIGCYRLKNGTEISWAPEKEDPTLNIGIYIHKYPIEEEAEYATNVEAIADSQWSFNGWLTAYLPYEIQMRSMSNSAFRNFIRLSEGYLRRSMNIPEMMKGMPDTRLAHEVDLFLSNTPDLNGGIVLPREYNSQVSFSRKASVTNPPNTPGWDYANVLPSGMTEEVIMPEQISSLALTQLRTECYINLIESQMNLAQQIRSVVEAAFIYFYAHFLQKDRYAYYVMLEARRQIETICLFVEHKIEFAAVSYWLVFPKIPPNDVQALLTTINSDESFPESEMNPFLLELTTNYAITDAGFVNKKVAPRRSKRHAAPTNIRESPVLAAALAPFIVKDTRHQTLAALPVFSWAPLKNIKYKEEKNANSTRPTSSIRKKKTAKKSTTTQ